MNITKIINAIKIILEALEEEKSENLATNNGDIGNITITGKVTKRADVRAYTTSKGKEGHVTRINIRMPEKINGTFFANCIAWTDKDDYQFDADDEVKFVGHFETNPKGYTDFIIAKDGNLCPKKQVSNPKQEVSRGQNSATVEDEDVPF